MSTMKEKNMKVVESICKGSDYSACTCNLNWLRREVRILEVIDNEGEVMFQ